MPLTSKNEDCRGPCSCRWRRHFPGEQASGPYPHVRVSGGGTGVVSLAGGVLLVETVRRSGLEAALSEALAPWRKPRVVHDPGKILLDVALAVAPGGDCPADVAVLRAEPGVFGPVAADPTVSRLIDTLASADPRALVAIRRARADVRERIWQAEHPGAVEPDAHPVRQPGKTACPRSASPAVTARRRTDGPSRKFEAGGLRRRDWGTPSAAKPAPAIAAGQLPRDVPRSSRCQGAVPPECRPGGLHGRLLPPGLPPLRRRSNDRHRELRALLLDPGPERGGRRPTQPAAGNPEELSGTGRWMHQTAVRDAQEALANGIAHLFGKAECPLCTSVFNIADEYTSANLPS